MRANVSAASSTSLTVTVPSGTTYQPISVTTNGLTGYSAQPFILTFPGGGSFNGGSFAVSTGFPVAYPSNASLGDLNLDGKLDLVVPNAIANTFSVYRNTGTSGNISFTGAGAYVTTQPLPQEEPFNGNL